MCQKTCKNQGFTLAEVLITLGVIGVVAAVSLPTLITNLTERRNSERHANIAQKVTQAMEQMRAHGLLNTQYASTDAFVDELQKYLKIAKRCDSDHVAECWPTEKVTTADGKEFEVSKTKTRKNLLKNTEDKTKNVGLVLADGASLIMTYDISANGIDVGERVEATKMKLPVGGGKMKEFPYSTNVAGAIDFVMDVNGKNGPNSEKIGDKWNDIRSFNKAQFGKGVVCDFEVENLCVKQLTTYSALDCSNSSSPDYDYCKSKPSGYSIDYWAGAKKACADIDMTLASKAQLKTIYAAKGIVSKVPNYGYFWASAEYNATTAWYKTFANSNESTSSKGSHYEVLCVDSN